MQDFFIGGILGILSSWLGSYVQANYFPGQNIHLPLFDQIHYIVPFLFPGIIVSFIFGGIGGLIAHNINPEFDYTTVLYPAIAGFFIGFFFTINY